MAQNTFKMLFLAVAAAAYSVPTVTAVATIGNN